MLTSVLLAALITVPPAEDVQGAVRDVLRDTAYQQAIDPRARAQRGNPRANPRPTGRRPRPDERETGDAEEWRAREGGQVGPGEAAPPPPRRQAPPRGGRDTSTGAFMQAVLWLVLAVLAVGVVAWLAGALKRGTPDAKRTPEATAPRATPALERPRTAAERLADEGRYAEAVHTLLLLTIQELARHVPGGVPPAHTSREIVAQSPMPAAAREALGRLVTEVERSQFGGRPVDASAYEACTACFHAFATAHAGNR